MMRRLSTASTARDCMEQLVAVDATALYGE